MPGDEPTTRSVRATPEKSPPVAHDIDVLIEEAGTICLFHLVTCRAEAWVNVRPDRGWYTLVGALVVDQSHADAFAHWMRTEGVKSRSHGGLWEGIGAGHQLRATDGATTPRSACVVVRRFAERDEIKARTAEAGSATCTGRRGQSKPPNVALDKLNRCTKQTNPYR